MATATYLGRDTTTRGDWIGVYGSGGYYVNGFPQVLPDFIASATVSDDAELWHYGVEDADALIMPGDPGTRWRAGWGSAPADVVFTVTPTDESAYVLRHYGYDWEGFRSGTIEIVDEVTGDVLDTQEYPTQTPGIWTSWEVAGKVRVRCSTPFRFMSCGLWFDSIGAPPDGRLCGFGQGDGLQG